MLTSQLEPKLNGSALRLSPRSFLAGRERQDAAGVLRAEHNGVFTVVSTCVAAAILAAVEGGILPPGLSA
jgi:hypothetical protein